MPSKKHRPIVMNRNNRPVKTYSVIKKAILVTAILAFVEIIILVFIHFKKANTITAKKQPPPKEISKAIIPSIAKDSTIIKTTLLPKVEQKANIPKRDSAKITPPVTQKVLPVVQPILKDTAVIHETRPRQIKMVNVVTDEKMFEILNEVRLEKLHANNTAKCISIQIINSSNAENGSRVAAYLRKNGYVISGREVVAGSQTGIRINALGPCLKLAIGSL